MIDETEKSVNDTIAIAAFGSHPEIGACYDYDGAGNPFDAYNNDTHAREAMEALAYVIDMDWYSHTGWYVGLTYPSPPREFSASDEVQRHAICKALMQAIKAGVTKVDV